MLGIKTSTECKDTLVTPVEEWDESVIAVLSPKPFRRRSRECHCGELYNLSSGSCAKRNCSKNKMSRFRYNQEAHVLITNPATAVGRSWFHATIDPHWGSMLATHSTPTHVGFETTAHAVGREYHDVTGGYWLYELRMKPSALIADYFCPDLCMGWTTSMEAFSELVQADFVGYVNQYETVGNVSFAGNPQVLNVISRQWIPLEAREKSIRMVEELVRGKENQQAPYLLKQAESLLQELLEAC